MNRSGVSVSIIISTSLSAYISSLAVDPKIPKVLIPQFLASSLLNFFVVIKISKLFILLNSNYIIEFILL